MQQSQRKNNCLRSGNVLLMRFSALGDVAMTVPVVYAACRANPTIQFTFLTRPLPAKIFVNPPANLRVQAVDTKAYEGPAGLYRLYKELQQSGPYPVVIDLHDVLRTKLLRLYFRLGGAKVTKIDKGRKEKKKLTASKGKLLRQLDHNSLRYRRAIEAAGIRVGELADSVYTHGKGDSKLFSSVTPPKESSEKWIAIAPFAAHKGKAYPPEKMEEVADELSRQPGVKVFLFGAGKEESNVLKSWTERNSRLIDISEARLGIPGEMSLMSHCDLMISMDSANMHLASAVGLRTISIWGATHPYCGFLGIGQSESDAVQLPLPCRPCSVFGNKPCAFGDYRCLTAISPSQILSKIPQ